MNRPSPTAELALPVSILKGTSVEGLLSGETNPLVDRCTRVVLFPATLRDPSDWTEIFASFDERYAAPIRALPEDQRLAEVRALVAGLECYLVYAMLAGATVAWDPGLGDSALRNTEVVELVRPILGECRAWCTELKEAYGDGQ